MERKINWSFVAEEEYILEKAHYEDGRPYDKEVELNELKGIVTVLKPPKNYSNADDETLSKFYSRIFKHIFEFDPDYDFTKIKNLNEIVFLLGFGKICDCNLQGWTIRTQYKTNLKNGTVKVYNLNDLQTLVSTDDENSGPQ